MNDLGRKDEAFAAVVDAAAAELVASGWTRFPSPTGLAEFFRETHDGILATAWIFRSGRSHDSSTGTSTRISVRLGAGYRPVLNLMPVVTLRPAPVLVSDEAQTVGYVSRPDDAAALGVRIAAAIVRDGPAFAARFHGPEDLAATIRRETTDGDVSALYVLMLGVLGRGEEAWELLADFPVGERRFIRQMTRWLDAGSRPAPPLDMAPRPGRDRHERSEYRRLRATAINDARLAVIARAKGKGVEEIKDLVIEEYGRREVLPAPSLIAVTAETIQLEMRPFGRARATAKAVGMLATVAVDGVRQLRQSAPDPEWLQRPDRAAFPIDVAPGRYASVEIDHAATEWVTEAFATTGRRFGIAAGVDVWLLREDAATVAAHIGTRRVGAIHGTDAARFDGAFRAAAGFDEDPYVEGRLTRLWTEPVQLDIPVPA